MNNKKPKEKQATFKKKNFNFRIIISLLLIIISFISGVMMLSFGIKETISLNQETKNYKQIEGYFLNYSIYDVTDKKTTYRLSYSYTVNRKEYVVSTKFGTEFIPKEGSTRTIKYNPNNPEEAVVIGTSSAIFLIFMGIIFITVPSIILLALLSALGYLKKLKSNFIEVIIGTTFLTLGFGVLYIITGSFSPIQMFKSYSLEYLLPFLITIMFIVVGLYMLIKGFKGSRKNS